MDAWTFYTTYEKNIRWLAQRSGNVEELMSEAAVRLPIIIEKYDGRNDCSLKTYALNSLRWYFWKITRIERIRREHLEPLMIDVPCADNPKVLEIQSILEGLEPEEAE